MQNHSPTVQSILESIQLDPTGARNLYRARRITSVCRQLREAKDRAGISVRDMAAAMETSPSQVQRVLSCTAPSNLTLDSVFRAAEALGIEVDFRLRDPARNSYYVQRGDFPVIREATCVTTGASGRDASRGSPANFSQSLAPAA